MKLVIIFSFDVVILDCFTPLHFVRNDVLH